MIINEEDCGTLRGLEVKPLKNNDEIVESLSERIFGRVSLHDVYNPVSDELIIEAGELFTEEAVKKVEAAELDAIEVRSALTCEAKKGICTKCYGVSLSTNSMVQRGEAVGVVAAQSIGEPGTQLTLRTFHVGGIAGNISEDSKMVANVAGELVIDDLKTVDGLDSEGNAVKIVISRTSEFKIIDKNSGIVLSTNNIPYGSHIFVDGKTKVKKGDVICQWDPYNGVIVSEFGGKAVFEDVIEGVTYQVEMDEQTGFKEKVISDSKKKRVIPTLHVQTKSGETQRSYSLPVGGSPFDRGRAADRIWTDLGENST